jgi:hypothetical protein
VVRRVVEPAMGGAPPRGQCPGTGHPTRPEATRLGVF